MKTYATKEVVEDMRGCIKRRIVVHAKRIDEPFRVDTLEGDYKQGKPGDYLMRGIDAELYICDADIFERSYEWADEPAQPEAGQIARLNAVVDMFAAAMKDRLAAKAALGWSGWDCQDSEHTDEFITEIAMRIEDDVPNSKQSVDIANFAMMLWHQAERAIPEQAAVPLCKTFAGL